MKQIIEMKKDKAGVYSVVAGMTAGGLAVVNQAHAALDPAIALGLATVQTDFNSLLALVYPIMIGVTVALVIFGLVKMFIHKSVGK